MAHVKLVLLEDVENLGLAGEEVSVAPGYARNYLVPRNLAMKSNAATARILEARKTKIEQQRAAELTGAKALAEKLAGISVTFAEQASGDGQLFGSVGARAIADKLKSEFGVEIEHTKIKLDDNIKSLGSFTVDVKLHHDVIAKLSLAVVRG